jgi:glycolate oxidase FAD binding subunit
MAVSADHESELARIVPGAVRLATDADSIDGTRPRWVVEPATAEAMAAVLAWASMNGQPVVLRGGGTHLDWGRRPSDIGVIVSTRQLNRITRYEPGDLTVSVEAGISVADLNRELARHGQWLPIDAASESATIGGAIATNDSGPLRHRYGTPRDQIIGVRLATADGRLAVAGGQVVKNVAGYDLGKLVAGSFGSLAGIVSATFKLAPMPPASTTLVMSFATGADMAAAAAAISASQLDSMSVVVEASAGRGASYRILVRLGGTPTANAEQAASAARIAAASKPSATEIVAGERDAALWLDRGTSSRRDSGSDVRASWLPASLPAVLVLLAEVAGEASVEIDVRARAAVGSGVLHIEGDAAARAAVIARLRQQPETIGHVVVTRGRDVKDRAEVWGPPLPTAGIAAAIKRALDPTGVLNAGRGPI